MGGGDGDGLVQENNRRLKSRRCTEIFWEVVWNEPRQHSLERTSDLRGEKLPVSYTHLRAHETEADL
eukprot:995790-Rhodomonas_salina.1